METGFIADPASHVIDPRTLAELFLEFLKTYIPQHDISDNNYDSDDVPYYVKEAEEMARTNTTTLYIDYAHMASYFPPDYLTYFDNSFHLLEPLLNHKVGEFISICQPEHLLGPRNKHKQWHISLFNYTGGITTVRELRPEKTGHLVSIRAMATKSTRSSPEILVASFRCNDCQSINTNISQQYKITLPDACINPACSNKRLFTLIPEDCTFGDWQQLTVQEMTDDLPPGTVPRTLRILLRDELVEVAKPGDSCIITGTLLAIPDVARLYSRTQQTNSNDRRQTELDSISGLKELGVREMSYKLALLTSNVTRLNGIGAVAKPDKLLNYNHDDMGNSNGILDDFEPEERRAIEQLRKNPEMVKLLVHSIAPSIYGHHHIKKGILLMLLGGVHKTTAKDRSSLRGDINMLLIGDPSTAKSQFLKFVCDFMPRAVYTSGKSSTAAGLTASVARDPDSGEFVIEAGALMLADNGICCIDEFDKMDGTDQSAIHEAMEQQTISITKAGIQATLNARTSILAAANPVRGRYDQTKILSQNVVISPPIMSRFDLYFILVDEPEETTDRAIARHMIATHLDSIRSTQLNQLGPLAQTSANPPQWLQQYNDRHRAQTTSTNMLRAYIRYARSIIPQMTPGAAALLRETYANLREKDILSSTPSSYRVTVRQLESLIRLSEASARMYLSETIEEYHVKEASELLHRAIVNVMPSEINLDVGFDDTTFDKRLDDYGGYSDDDDDDDMTTTTSKTSNDENGGAGTKRSRAARNTSTTTTAATTTTTTTAAAGKEGNKKKKAYNPGALAAAQEAAERVRQLAVDKNRFKLTTQQYYSVVHRVLAYLIPYKETDQTITVKELRSWIIDLNPAELEPFDTKAKKKTKSIAKNLLRRLATYDFFIDVDEEGNVTISDNIDYVSCITNPSLIASYINKKQTAVPVLKEDKDKLSAHQEAKMAAAIMNNLDLNSTNDKDASKKQSIRVKKEDTIIAQAEGGEQTDNNGDGDDDDEQQQQQNDDDDDTVRLLLHSVQNSTVAHDDEEEEEEAAQGNANTDDDDDDDDSTPPTKTKKAKNTTKTKKASSKKVTAAAPLSDDENEMESPISDTQDDQGEEEVQPTRRGKKKTVSTPSKKSAAAATTTTSTTRTTKQEILSPPRQQSIDSSIVPSSLNDMSDNDDTTSSQRSQSQSSSQSTTKKRGRQPKK